MSIWGSELILGCDADQIVLLKKIKMTGGVTLCFCVPLFNIFKRFIRTCGALLNSQSRSRSFQPGQKKSRVFPRFFYSEWVEVLNCAKRNGPAFQSLHSSLRQQHIYRDLEPWLINCKLLRSAWRTPSLLTKPTDLLVRTLPRTNYAINYIEKLLKFANAFCALSITRFAHLWY